MPMTTKGIVNPAPAPKRDLLQSVQPCDDLVSGSLVEATAPGKPKKQPEVKAVTLGGAPPKRG